MKRREFLAAIGAAAAAVALNVVPLAQSAGPTPVESDDVKLRPGDIFTIQGRYAVNPITQQSTGHLQRFMVTAVVGADISAIPSDGFLIDRKQARPDWVTV